MRTHQFQFSLMAVVWTMAGVAYFAAVCSHLSRGNLIGFITTLFAQAMIWFVIWFHRLCNWPESPRA